MQPGKSGRRLDLELIDAIDEKVSNHFDDLDVGATHDCSRVRDVVPQVVIEAPQHFSLHSVDGCAGKPRGVAGVS